MPPPSTRSISSTPVDQVRADSVSISPIGLAGFATLRAFVTPAVGGPTSCTVPQAWHSLHRPTHLAADQPHSTQR
jgi:hypothetical protein